MHFVYPPPPTQLVGVSIQNWRGRREGRLGGRDGWEGMEGCDRNCEVGAYGMAWVHNREPERSRVTSYV